MHHVVAPRRSSSPLEQLFAHFGHPHGRLGAIVGHVMAWENRAVNALVVEQLTLEPSDVVLDVGCGPGVAVATASRRATAGLVVGADPSPVMVAQARRRNRAGIGQGRIEVTLAPAEQLPYAAERFTAALSVNSVAHWSNVAAGMAELHRVLAPHGRLVLAPRAERRPDAADPHAHGATPERIRALMTLMRASGFIAVGRRDHDLRRERLVTLTARKPATP